MRIRLFEPAIESKRVMLALVRHLSNCLRRRALDVARLRRDAGGATAVEFALIAPAFLSLIFAIFQVTLFLFAQQTLQNAAIEGGRMFLTGSAQNAGLTQTQFANDVCPMVQALFNCNKLQINVSTTSSFGSASTSAPSIYDSSGNLLTTGSYGVGLQGDIMVVQLAYPWPIFGTPLGSILPSTGYGTTVLTGTTAFRVEPY
jgi:Flp pilus assembly protein TadG